MDELPINANKLGILKDFIAHLPYILDNAYTCDRIIQEFIDVGMLDEKHKF